MGRSVCMPCLLIGMILSACPTRCQRRWPRLHIDTVYTGAVEFDLNLVRLFVAVFESRSVSKAAEVLDISQPTVSYGLKRLRENVGDHLFLRSGRGIVPTPLATDLYARFREGVSAIDSALESASAFDPSTSRRTFRIAMSDVGAVCFVPPLLSHLRVAAPNVALEIVQVAVAELDDELASGKLDLAVGNLKPRQSSVLAENLFAERYVCLFAGRHPRIKSELTKKMFLQESHVVIASPFSVHQQIEESMRERGLERDIALKLPQFPVLPAVIGKTDYLAVLPSRLAEVFCADRRLKYLELPVPVPTFEVRSLSHVRQRSNPANLWIRSVVRSVLGKL